MLVGETGLLGESPRREQGAKSLPSRRLSGKLDDFDEALAGEPFQIEIGQAQRDVELANEVALPQRPTPADGGEDFEVAFEVSWNSHTVFKI